MFSAVLYRMKKRRRVLTDTRSYHEPFGNPCKLCGKPIEKHRKHHGGGTRAERKYWIGIDGEGIGRRPHRYVIMAWSDETGKRCDAIENELGLTTRQCLDFLLDLPVDARIAGYYLSYDWTMILRDLPNRLIYRLLRPELRYRGKDEGGGFTPIHWRDYKLDHVGKMFRVKKGSKSVTIWDVGNFFQSTFIAALKKWSITNDAEIDAIATMKERRSRFTQKDFKAMGEYCMSECRLLAQLISRLDEAHTDAGLKLKTWHGPGSTANVALDKMGIAEKRGEVPDGMREAIRCAFFGGRFEQSLCAEVKGPVWGYDIVSAYPYQAYNLPCLEHGVWEHVTTNKQLRNVRHALVHFELDDDRSRPWAALPVRLHNGCIVFPQTGASGWVWLEEYRQACERWGVSVRFIEAWTLRSDCECRPFELVLQYFREREKLGKDARGHTFRLGINSIYGKLVQTVGQPRFRSLIWGGMITSGCRAQLLDLMYQIGLEHVYAVATDGIYSSKRYNWIDSNLPLGAGIRLGSWEEKELGDTVFVRPGIYWDTDKLARARGIGTRQLIEHKQKILEAIRNGDTSVEITGGQAFGSARNTIYRTQGGRILRSDRYGQWFPLKVELSLEPGPKRAPGWALWELDGVESVAYKHSA
jgi:hypothetical protein